MGIPGDIVEGKPGRDHAASWGETYNITALETLTPGKVENFTEPDAPAVYPAERAKWIAARASGKQYKMPKPVRGDYAVVEVEDQNAHLLADTMTADKAIELLRSRADQSEPFFLAVGFVRPHFPFVSTHSTIGRYYADGLSVPSFPEDDHADVPPQSIGTVMKFDDEPIQKLRRGYYGAIGFMDQQVGRLLGELERSNLRDNTIVVFVSDHGYLLGEHQMWKKSKLWEEAIRVPLIISAPGKKRGVKCEHTVELVDLYPTLTELAGLPGEPGVQGQSLTPLLDGPSASLPRTDALIQVSAGFGLRSNKWAYMWYPASRKHKQEGFMLYDMEKDPNQYTNLATNPKYASIKTQLHERLMKRIQAARN
jgi:arylsulfatase A-like enzyme